jgi:hypothetical protein
MSIKDKLNNTTGVQRLFLVCLALCWIYFGIFESLTQANKSSEGNSSYEYSMSKDFENPACAPYTFKPIAELKEPEYSQWGGNCYHIYLTRKYHTDFKLPLTLEAYKRKNSIEYWIALSTYFAIYTVFVFILFALIFVAYWLIRWIFAGFKKKE